MFGDLMFILFYVYFICLYTAQLSRQKLSASPRQTYNAQAACLWLNSVHYCAGLSAHYSTATKLSHNGLVRSPR